MKRLLVGLLILPFLSGCTFLNAWVIKGDGKDMSGSYAITSGKADRLDVLGFRYLLITTEKVTTEFLQNLPTIKIIVDKD